MNKKFSAVSLTALPLLLLGGVLTQVNSADAAILTGELQLGGALDLGIDTRPGSIGGFAVLFEPAVPGGVGAAPVDTYAFMTIGNANNSGSFEIFNSPNDFTNPATSYSGEVLSFDTLTDFSSLPFMRLPAVSSFDDPGMGASILATDIFLEDFTIGTPIQSGDFVRIAFLGHGFALNDGVKTPVRFDFTAQGAGTLDSLLNIQYSYSGTVIASTPESSGVGAMMLLGGVFVGGRLLKKSNLKTIS